MKEIQLTQGKAALVDDEDFEWLNQWKWCAHKSDSGVFYARRRGDGNKTIHMHRVIMDTPDNLECDHKDNNGLNCQRYNLRNCTRGQNNSNRRKTKKNTSGFKGVSWQKSRNKWRVQLQINGVKKFFGLFDRLDEAANAYDEAAKENHKEFSNVNFKD